ncbi:hypothetical protein SK128_016676 [Halocaridina rubra]|uniref:Uncharacterized protein n=1 Tax=Halocaridina rubra TaxID=373956 RepID=A0AAN9AAE4_HALRR
MRRFWVLSVVTLGALIAPSVSEEAKDVQTEKGKYLFGSYSTATYTVVQASTSTVYFSCIQGSAADLCAGRKRASKMLQKSTEPLIEGRALEGDSQTNLESSKSDDTQALETRPKESDGKFAFTIWTTSKTTTSITVFYTNTSTTIRLSYACVAGGMSKPSDTCNG